MSRPRQWLVVTAASPSEAQIPALAEGLVALGASAVEEDGLTLRTFLPATTTPDEVIAALRDTLDGAAPDVRLEWQEDQDWLALWRAGLGPRRIGERLIVTPSWASDRIEMAERDVVVTIDPEMAFGTGEHASTRGVLRLLEAAVRPGAVALDVGAGSAILAIAAAKLGAAAVAAVESDSDAIENAIENVARNDVADRVSIACERVDEEWLHAHGVASWDLITANVLSGVLVPLLPAFHGSLRPAAALLLGGILQAEAATVLAAATAAGFALEREDREDDWWSGWFVRVDAVAR